MTRVRTATKKTNVPNVTARTHVIALIARFVSAGFSSSSWSGLYEPLAPVNARIPAPVFNRVFSYAYSIIRLSVDGTLLCLSCASWAVRALETDCVSGPGESSETWGKTGTSRQVRQSARSEHNVAGSLKNDWRAGSLLSGSSAKVFRVAAPIRRRAVSRGRQSSKTAGFLRRYGNDPRLVRRLTQPVSDQ